MVEVYGALLFARRLCQFFGSSSDFPAMASMSYASARVTTSACKPSITARACLPEPPCDCLMTTSTPVLAFQYLLNAALKSWYSSRVGS